MVTPVCSKCKYLTDEAEKFRPCPHIPVFHRNMLCSNEKNAFVDKVSGAKYRPLCEEVNRHGECLAYYPKELEPPEIIFDEGMNEIVITGTSPISYTTDGTKPSAKSVIDKNVEAEKYVCSQELSHSCVVKAACVRDGVLSDIVSLSVEIPDVPEITFDKSTNTVTISSYNKIYFTTDGSKVTEDSEVYTEPFVITRNTRVKARSFCLNDFSKEIEKYCISIEAPVIEFDADDNIVSIKADDPILYSTDGSDIYDDADEYDGDFMIEKNTTVKAACIVDGELSEQAELLCKVPNKPVIEYNPETFRVTIKAENPVRYTTDGNDVKKKDNVYSSPFLISKTVKVKAVSFVGDRLSEQAEKKCVFVTPPVIEFDKDTGTVTITGENKILCSTDGKKVYDDEEEYTAPFVIEKNTTVRACCILDGTLSAETTLVCKVPSKPSISFNKTTKQVTIMGENTILYTTDGSDVKKKDSEYKAAFRITKTTTVKAKAFVNNRLSEQAELVCEI